jgi:hypothetical protein
VGRESSSVVFETEESTLLEALILKINLAPLKRFIPVIVGLFVLPFLVQSAQASEVDFVCGGTASPILPCSGSIATVYTAGSLTSASDTASPITVVNSQGPEVGTLFVLVFDTSSVVPNIFLTNGVESLSGDIVFASGFQFGTENDVDLGVNWTSLPADFAAFLGTSTGTGITTNVVLSIDNADATTTVSITPGPAPEPSSLLLLGSGLVSFGGLLRRRILRA